VTWYRPPESSMRRGLAMRRDYGVECDFARPDPFFRPLLPDPFFPVWWLEW
jgi:hypothetical protein